MEVLCRAVHWAEQHRNRLHVDVMPRAPFFRAIKRASRLGSCPRACSTKTTRKTHATQRAARTGNEQSGKALVRWGCCIRKNNAYSKRSQGILMFPCAVPHEKLESNGNMVCVSCALGKTKRQSE